MLLQVFLILVTVLLNAKAQPFGELSVSINPKIVTPGDSVSFSAGYMELHLCPYNSTYRIMKQATGPAVDSFLVSVISEPTGGYCATAAGYSGPFLRIAAPEAGHYRIQFDSTSVFKADMGDTATFLVSLSSSIKRHPRGYFRIWQGLDGYRINGQKIISKP